MRFLTTSLILIFLTTFASAQDSEYPLDDFNDWDQFFSSAHDSPLWVSSSLEQVANVLNNDDHSEDDVKLLETHYVNSDRDREAILVCEPSEEGCENLLMVYLAYNANGDQKDVLGLYTKNSERDVWELIPDNIWPNGTPEQFVGYMYEKLGKYIYFHG